MAAAAKAVSGPALHPDGRFASTLTPVNDPLQLSPTVCLYHFISIFCTSVIDNTPHSLLNIQLLLYFIEI